MKYLYQGKGVLVVDKPAGVSVHAGHNNAEKTVVDFIKDKVKDSDSERPGIVHRLDKDTSGVLVIAKTPDVKRFLQAQFKNRQVQKVYLALVRGVPKLPKAILDWPIGRHPKNPFKRAVRGRGKEAVTEYKIKESFGGKYALLEVRPQTGRTHQIRVHLAHLGHPIVGDRVYGHPEPNLNRHWLHAHSLTIRLPSGSTKTFTSPLPADLKEFLKSVNRFNGR